MIFKQTANTEEEKESIQDVLNRIGIDRWDEWRAVVLETILTGAMRFLERLYKAGIVAPDCCQGDGCERPEERIHLFWACDQYDHSRSKFPGSCENIVNDPTNHWRCCPRHNFLPQAMPGPDPPS